MEFLKWVISISILIGIFTSPVVVPLQALVYKMVKGTPYLHTLYYCGVRSMKIQRILFYIVVPVEFIFLLAGGFQTTTNNSNIKAIFIMAIATLFSYGFLVLWEKFFRRKLNEYNQKLNAGTDTVLDDGEEVSEIQNNNLNTQEKKTHIDDFIPEDLQKRKDKPGFIHFIKLYLYISLFLFFMSLIVDYLADFFKTPTTIPSSSPPKINYGNNSTPKVDVPRSDVSGVQIEFANFGLKYEYKSGNTTLTDREVILMVENGLIPLNDEKLKVSTKYINFKVSNLKPQQINGAIFKIQLYDVFDRTVCFTGIENSTVGFDKALEFQKTINPNTSDIVQVEVPFECQNSIDPTKQHKYSITILRVV